MVCVLFTLDYEIHGNGEGSSFELMVEPTARLLREFGRFGAKLTIMADIAEILKFKEYAAARGRDDYHYHDIVVQLQQAVRDGHDVQLHIHSSYFNARHDGRCWVQDWSEYDFAGLPAGRMDQMVKTGKEFLESILRPVKPGYRCHAFRAANWSVSPSANVVEALTRNAIHIDTSVFKFGRRTGLVNFDYSQAANEMRPWRADKDAIWRQDSRGGLWEVPIYSENRWLGAFFSPNRIYRVLASRRHRFPQQPEGGAPSRPHPNGKTAATSAPAQGKLNFLSQKHAWKADFNQCTGTQLIRALNRAARCHDRAGETVPFVLIGHSKLFTSWNERSLRPFLRYIAKHPRRFGFGTFDSLGLSSPERFAPAPGPQTT